MTLPSRLGAAFRTSGSAGVALDVAKATTSDVDAAVAGRMLSAGNPFAGVSAAQVGRANQAAAVEKADPWGALRSRMGEVVTTLGEAANFGLNTTKRYYQSVYRGSVTRQAQSRNNPLGGLLSGVEGLAGIVPGLGLAFPDIREQWGKVSASTLPGGAVRGAGSLGQTFLAPFRDPNQADGDPFEFLDDPRFAQPGVDPETGDPTPSERDLYFSSGVAKWLSGTADFAADLALDPLNYVGFGAGSANRARQVVTATDVAKASRALTQGATVAGKPDRIATFIANSVDASERVLEQQLAGVKGGYAALAATGTYRSMLDGGTVVRAYQLADDLTDEAARIAAKVDANLAALGDDAALKRLRSQHEVLSLQLESLAGPDRTTQIQALLERGDRRFIDNLADVDSDEFLTRVGDAYADQLKAERDVIDRLTRGGAAGVALSGFRATSGREFLGVAKTLTTASGLPRVHVLARTFGTGLHAPSVVHLDDMDFLTKFSAHIADSKAFLRNSPKAVAKLDSLLDRAATTPTGLDQAAARIARRDLVDEYQGFMDAAVARRIASKSPAQLGRARQLVREVRTRRTDAMAHLHVRAYQATPGRLALTQAPEGVAAFASRDLEALVGTPVSPTQLDQVVSLGDYGTIYRRVMEQTGGDLSGWVRKTTGVSASALDSVNDLWKFGTLFRLGYTLRTQVDTQARMLVTLGPLRYFTNTLVGSQNFLYNRGKVTVAEAQWARDVWNAHRRLDEIAGLEHPAAFGHLGRQVGELPPGVQREVDALQAVIDTPRPAPGGAMVRRGNTALGRYIGKARVDKGESTVGTAYRSLEDFVRETQTVSAKESVLGLFVSDSEHALGRLRASGMTQNIPGGHRQWPQAYAEYVNRHIRNNPAAMRILMADAPSTDELLRAYYRGEGPDGDIGRAVFEEMKASYPSLYNEPDDLIEQLHQQLDLLAPDETIRQRIVAGDISAVDAESVYASKTARPTVPSERLEAPDADARAFSSALENMRTKWFAVMGELPETMWGRHPFYVDRKASYIEAALGEAAGNGSKVTVAEYNQMAKRAAALAKKDVSRYMFDTSQRSNIQHTLRWLSPFYGAWSDTMRKWALIMGEHPEALSIGRNLPSVPRAMFLVTDDDGNQILPNGNVVDADGNVIRASANPFEGYIHVPLPEWFLDSFGGKVGDFFDPARAGEARVPINALNVIFQGEPFWLPGPGPLATIPVNHLARSEFPEMWDDQNPVGVSLRYILPYGLDTGPLDEATPAWLRNMAQIFKGNSDPNHAQVYASLLAEEVNAERQGLTPTLLPGELNKVITNRVRNWYLLRLLGSETGLNIQPATRLDYWRDEYQRYKRTYPDASRLNPDGTQMGADAAFYADHPDYFEASISLSQNDTGISATDESWAPTKKYLSNIQANPKYGWMWVGAANLAPGFDSGVYTAQKALGLRSTKDPHEAYSDMKVSEGWYEYNKANGMIQAELEKRAQQGGSGSLSAGANIDLRDMKDQWLVAYKALHPEWAAEYESGSNGSGADAFIRYAAQALQEHPELADRRDFYLLEEYMLMRELVRAKLDERGLATIDSPDAADLQLILDTWTTWAVNDDLGFQQMFNRGQLDRDLIGRTSSAVGGGV